MKEIEARSEFNQEEYFAQLAQNAHETAAIFGLSGLHINVVPGRGWSSARAKDKIILNIDPFQLIERRTPSDEIDETHVPELQIPETKAPYVRHTTCHELGHIKDFIDPEFKVDLGETKSDHFFWNAIDDAVIDKRLRNIPALDDCTDELYSQVLFPKDSFVGDPKHLQLMHGLMISSVTGVRPELDEDVNDILDHLSALHVGSSVYDVMSTLSHTSTKFKQRREIAAKYIKPYFDQFLEEDKRNSPDQDFDKNYNEYEDTRHGDGHGHGDALNEDDSEKSDQNAGQSSGGSGEDGSDDQSSQPSGSGDQNGSVHSVIMEASDQLKKVEVEQRAKQSSAQKPPNQPLSTLPSGNGAGGIAAELNLSPGDAAKYLEGLQHYRAEIFAVARAFESLAVPSESKVSPRYTNRANFSGSRLHGRRLAQAAIQLQTGTEQAIWRSVEQRGRRVDFSLEQLDVHLLVDVSVSMKENGRAQNAAATALILMEGLELARHNMSRKKPNHQKPDVRLQVTAFGASHQIIAPIGFSIQGQQKGKTFTSLSNPNSGSTLIDGALKSVETVRAAHPKRNQLVFIISDGDFYAPDEIKRRVDKWPSQKAHIIQLIINSPRSKAITDHFTHTDDPKRVPGAVSTHLKKFVEKLLAG